MVERTPVKASAINWGRCIAAILVIHNGVLLSDCDVA